MAIFSALKRHARAVVHHGRDRLGRLVFERGDFVDTATWGDEASNPEHVRYEPSGWTWVWRALRHEQIDDRNVFLDYGSGKGRVLFQAARYPFGRVVGVDLSEELCGIARQNLERNRARMRCQAFEVVAANVLGFEPPDDVTHAYLFNPFTGEVFMAAIEALLRSYDRSPRPLRVLYVNPVETAALMQTGRFRHVRTTQGVKRTLLSRLGIDRSERVGPSTISVFDVVPA